MKWNTSGGDIDNLQVYVVFRYNAFKPPAESSVNDGIFGNSKNTYDRFVGAFKNYLIIGGARKPQSSDDDDEKKKRDPDYLSISCFPNDANPMTLGKFSVLGIHWNNKDLSCCVWY